MTIERHLLDRIDMTLFTRESVYGGGVGLFATNTCRMLDYDDASPHVEWDDTVVGNTDVLTGFEFPTHQEIARQSMTMTYTEPRTKPNTVAGLLGMAMGAIPTTVTYNFGTARRHKLLLGGATALPSISVRVLHDQAQAERQPDGTYISTVYRYDGVKVSTLTLSNNGPYWQLQATLMGSGRRVPISAGAGTIVAVDEHWLRWGDTRFWLRPLTSGKIAVPGSPTQGAHNLTGGATTGVVNISSWVRACSLTINNNLSAEEGYRAGSGVHRRQLQGTRREITAELTFDVDSTYEVRALDNYLKQYNMAFEIDVTSTEPIVVGHQVYYGFQVILPAIRLARLTRGQQDQLENLTYRATAFEDPTGVNNTMYAWVYNKQSRYLT